jgi:hypothetical protein
MVREKKDSFRDVEKTLCERGVYNWEIDSVYEKNANGQRCEVASYLIKSHQKGKNVASDCLEEIANWAKKVGYGVFFSSIDVFETFATALLKSGEPFLGVGVVATFYPRVPYERAKSIMRSIRMELVVSLHYHPADTARQENLENALEMEKELLLAMQEMAHRTVYSGPIEKHPMRKASGCVKTYLELFGDSLGQNQKHDLSILVSFGELQLNAPRYIPNVWK